MGKNIYIPFRALSIDDRERERERARPSCTHREIRASQTSKNARENAINRRHRVRTSSVGRAGRSGVFASTSSFVVVVVIGCSSTSAAAVRPRRVVRRRPDIVFVFASHSHDGRHPDAARLDLSFPHVRRAFSMCPNCVFLSMRARDDRGRVFHTVSSMFVFHHSNSIRDTRVGDPRVGVSDMWKRRGWASTVD